MANSEFEYVRNYEQRDSLLPSCWIVVRIDGRGFSKLCQKYDFTKPNDQRGIALMNAAASEVVRGLSDVVLAYGQSDEYSFVFHASTTLFDRRASKLATTVAAMFTAEYCLQWPMFFGEKPLTRPYPTFDGRCVCYPTRKILRDYLSWRQADCHVNNLYNTTFWHLVLKGGMSTTAAEEELKGSVAAEKNEILFSRFGVNYNDEWEGYRKGTVIFRAYEGATGEREGVREGSLSKTQMEKERKRKQKAWIAREHVDIIGDAFWEARPYILAGKKGDAGGE